MINRLRAFNSFWDAFILEAIKPLAMLSMAMGTVAVFSLNGLAIAPWFAISWSIVQALSIDGLFFVSWDRLFREQFTRASLGMLFVGIVSGVTAITISTILGFQVLWDIADSQVAMTRLGISSSLFTSVRATLAIATFIMIAYVRSHLKKEAMVQGEVAIAESPSLTPEVYRQAVEEAREVYRKEFEKIGLLRPHSPSTDEASPSIAEDHDGSAWAMPSLPTRSSPVKEKIIAVWHRLMEEGNEIKLTQVAAEAGVGYSTVKKYASEIKKEFGT